MDFAFRVLAFCIEPVKLLGQQAVVELVGILGYYCLVSLTLNIFHVGLPEGETPQLK